MRITTVFQGAQILVLLAVVLAAPALQAQGDPAPKLYRWTDKDGKEHYNLALSSARKGHWADAEFHITRAITLIPYLPEPWQLAVKLALMQERWQLAQEHLKRSLVAVPEDTQLQRLADEIGMAV